MRSNPILPFLIAVLIIVAGVMFVRYGMPKVTTTSPSSSSLGRGAGDFNACNAVRHQRKHCRQSSLKGRF